MPTPDLIRIAGPVLSAAINPLGAELTHLADAQGRELMTDADPAFWSRHAPILFPIVGAAADGVIRVDGTEYPMGQHGFARDRMFDVVEHAPDRVRLRLIADDATRTHYPFDFTLELAYALDGARLTVEATVGNPADTPLPAQFGFHPGFAWPLPFGQDRAVHRIVFAADEPGRLREIAEGGLIAEETRDSPLDGRVLALRDDLFTNDALIWDPVVSDAVTYGAPDGPSLVIGFPDTPRLGIWTKPGARFVCVEPWHGIADPEGYRGEFADKPGVFVVAPGGETRITMSVTLVS